MSPRPLAGLLAAAILGLTLGSGCSSETKPAASTTPGPGGTTPAPGDPGFGKSK